MDTPALDTQYSPRLVLDTTALQLDTLTITPLRPSSGSWAIICLATAWVRNKQPLVLMPTTRSKLSSVISSRSERTFGATPALLTSASMRPKAFTASDTMRSRSSWSPTSAWT